MRRPRSRGLMVVVVVVLLTLVRYWQQHRPSRPPSSTQHQSGRLPPSESGIPESLAEGLHRVERVVDGDTLLMADRSRIRLMGVDTPETVKPDSPVEPFGPEASKFTKQFVADGNNHVHLQFDQERKDDYDRFLAYVFVGDRMLNEELVRAGLAEAKLSFRFSQTMKRRLGKAEDEARAAGRGIWSLPVDQRPRR